MAVASGSAPAAAAEGHAQAKRSPIITTVAGLMEWRNGVTVVARVVEGCKKVVKSKLRAPMGAKELLPPDSAPEPRHQWYAVVADGTAAISVVLTMGDCADAFTPGALVAIRNAQPSLAPTSSVAAARCIAPRTPGLSTPAPFAVGPDGARRLHCAVLLVHEPWTQVTALASPEDAPADLAAAAAAVPPLASIVSGSGLSVPDLTAASGGPFPAWAEGSDTGGAGGGRRDAGRRDGGRRDGGGYRRDGGRRDGGRRDGGNRGRRDGSSRHRSAPSHAEDAAAGAGGGWAGSQRTAGPVSTPSLSPGAGASGPPAGGLTGYATAAQRNIA